VDNVERARTTRAARAGEKMGLAILEMAHLMYQNRTALVFYRSLTQMLNEERQRREAEYDEQDKSTAARGYE
jgi:hypothetical protein